jgi:hypothetical protein
VLTFCDFLRLTFTVLSGTATDCIPYRELLSIICCARFTLTVSIISDFMLLCCYRFYVFSAMRDALSVQRLMEKGVEFGDSSTEDEGRCLRKDKYRRPSMRALEAAAALSGRNSNVATSARTKTSVIGKLCSKLLAKKKSKEEELASLGAEEVASGSG